MAIKNAYFIEPFGNLRPNADESLNRLLEDVNRIHSTKAEKIINPPMPK
ncbi:MAG: hypothetical protein QF470_01265 [Methylococcales bacterium]|nr:hypothetical protein [Methylococcales bacterium]